MEKNKIKSYMWRGLKWCQIVSFEKNIWWKIVHLFKSCSINIFPVFLLYRAASKSFKQILFISIRKSKINQLFEKKTLCHWLNWKEKSKSIPSYGMLMLIRSAVEKKSKIVEQNKGQNFQSQSKKKQNKTLDNNTTSKSTVCFYWNELI